MNYGARIKALIDDNDIKQKRLAAALNLTESTLSNYITGRTNIPPDVLVAIADYFSVTVDYLLGHSDNPLPPFSTSPSEQGLIERFRTLSREQKELILQNVDLMSRQNQR